MTDKNLYDELGLSMPGSNKTFAPKGPGNSKKIIFGAKKQLSA